VVTSEAIFRPVGVLAMWTLLVYLLIGISRLRAVRGRRVSPKAFLYGESAEVPPDVRLPNRNLMNLLEAPVLFYLVCLCLYITHHVTRGVVTLAWVYVGLRLAHSLIHLTTNRVTQRLLAFAASNFVLVALWIRFLGTVF
jgi:hypothetical protein